MSSILPGIRFAVKNKLCNQLRRCRLAAVRIRYLIIINLLNGRSAYQTAKVLHVHNTTVYRVARRFRSHGEWALYDGREDNGSTKLDDNYLAVLYRVVRGTPQHYGWRRPTWTRELLIETLVRKTGLRASRIADASLPSSRARPVTQSYNNMMKALFLHGWQSVPGGVKPTYLKNHGHEVVNPALPHDDFSQAVRIAQAELDRHQPQAVGRLVEGRGRGDEHQQRRGQAGAALPGLEEMGHSQDGQAGHRDLAQPGRRRGAFADSEELVKNSGLPAWTLIEVGGDHRLADSESLETMLEACLVDDEDEAGEEEADDILERDWTDLCCTAAQCWAREAEDDGWVVVHGTVLSERAGKRIEHAWCERGDVVVDHAMPVGARIIDRERYYRMVQPEVRKAYSSEDAVILAIKNRHDGPWDDTEQLKE